MRTAEPSSSGSRSGEAITGVSRGLSADIPPVGPRLPGPLAAVAGRGRAAAAVRERLQRRPARRGRPGCGRAGGVRHDLHGAAVRRARAARPAERLPRHAPRLERGRARDDGRARDPGIGRDQERPELRADGHLGRAARARSSSSAFACRGSTSDREIGLAIATELRTLIDYHNVRVYRLVGEDLVPVAMQGNIGEYHRRDARAAQGQVRRGHHRLGRRAPRRPEPAGRREGPPGQHDPRHRGRARRVDAARADDLRGPGPRGARALEARAAPVQRRRPAAARDLRAASPPRRSRTPMRPTASGPSPRRSSGSSRTSAACSRSPSRS